jgi:hypothetical protein
MLCCKAGHAEDAPHVADSVANNSGGSPGTAAERLEEFSKYHAAGPLAKTPGERARLARGISRSSLTFAEKAWLLYELADPERNYTDVIAVAGAADDGFGTVSGWMRTVTFSNGLTVVSSDIDGSQRNVTLAIEISEAHPDGSLGQGDTLVRWPRPDGSASQESGSGEKPPIGSAGPQRPSCELYAQCCSAENSEERVELAEVVRLSDLSESNKSWLLFNLIGPGIPAEEAHRILGGDLFLERSWRAFIPDVLLEPPTDWESYQQTGVHRPARYYGCGVSVYLTEDEKHVESVRLGLKKSSSDVIRGEDIWLELFPPDDAKSQDHPLPPEAKPDE